MKNRLNMSGCPTSPRVMVSWLTFIAVAGGGALALKLFDLPPLNRAAIAFTAVAAFAWFIFAWVRTVRELDEMQRRIQLEALAVAYPLAILLVFMKEYLEGAGFHIPVFESDAWLLTLLPYFIGLMLAHRRYR